MPRTAKLLSTEELAEEMSEAVWERIDPPLWWDAIQDHIVADGMIGELRGHMVAGHAEHGRVVRGAYVIGQADWPNARYSDKLSHLSVVVQQDAERAHGLISDTAIERACKAHWPTWDRMRPDHQRKWREKMRAALTAFIN